MPSFSMQGRGKQLSSKLSNFIAKAKDEVVRVKDEVAQQRGISNYPGQQEGRGVGPARASIPSVTKPSVNKQKPPSINSSPSFTTQPPSTNTNNLQNISRIVQNTLASQIPIPCTHCHSIPLMFQHHPFFGPTQRICATHPIESVIRCVSCFRYQPKNQPFTAIGTSSARICPACARTAILDDTAARRLYENVLQFMQSQGLDMFQGKMMNVPVYLVDENSMNQQSSSIGCNANEQKRGLCIWSEQHLGLPDVVGVARSATSALRRVIGKNSGATSSRPTRSADVDSDTTVRRNHWAGMRHVQIRKILCLKGLPATLMASILAHEATHAWLAINPLRRDGVVGDETSFGQIRRIDQTVEEGMCQLVSHLCLQQLMANDEEDRFMDRFNGDGPSDVKLNQYYKWSIENHASPIYGGGFKKAAKAYTQTVESGGGLKELLQYVSIHRDFPPL